MALLDAALAFALTLAALATIVTIILEILIRVLGLRKRDQFELVKRLYDDYLAKDIGLTSAQLAVRQQALARVLKNPFVDDDINSAKKPSYLGGGFSPIYDSISVEHLLRRLMEVPEIRAAYTGTNMRLKEKLKDLAQKYDEYCSAISTLFKQRAQVLSLIFGVLLALAMNVDGVRLFQSYLDNPEKTAAVIGKADEILKAVEASQADLKEAVETPQGQGDLKGVEEALTRLETQAKLLQASDLPFGRHYYPHCWLIGSKALRAESVDPDCKETAPPGNDAKGTMPAGTVMANADDNGRTEPSNLGWLCANLFGQEFLTWLVKVVVTGLLIGLGAPFWYDVAKRLAEVRQAFGGKGSAAQRHGGSDGDAKKGEDRATLISRVADDLDRRGQTPTPTDAAPQGNG